MPATEITPAMRQAFRRAVYHAMLVTKLEDDFIEPRLGLPPGTLTDLLQLVEEAAYACREQGKAKSCLTASTEPVDPRKDRAMWAAHCQK
jgi:hypothetical protein